MYNIFGFGASSISREVMIPRHNQKLNLIADIKIRVKTVLLEQGVVHHLCRYDSLRGYHPSSSQCFKYDYHPLDRTS